MNPHVSAITLGVRDMGRARTFYGDGLGWPVRQEHGDDWVSFGLGGGAAELGLYAWDALAEAERAGGTVLKPAETAPWGGCSGYFADPEGYLWKVAAGTGDHPYAE